MTHRGRSACAYVFMAALTGLAACGAGEEPIDPADLELRDLLGVAPRVAGAWDAAQREAAREVLASGLGERASEALDVRAPDIDQARVVAALAAVDDRLLDRDRDALGLVLVEDLDTEPGGRAIDAPGAAATLLGEPTAATVVLELDARAWPCPEAAACNLDVLAALAADAAPGAARVRVVPVAQLAVIAALLPDAGGTPTLLVNPIVTAVGDPTLALAATGGGGFAPVFAAPARRPVQVVPLVTATWVYAPTIDDCVSGVQGDCSDCLAGGTCEPIWNGVSGMDACATLQANAGENYELLCINLAVSLGAVGSCLQRDAPSCAFDAMAILDPSDLRANVRFISDATCRAELEDCLAELYGTPPTDDGGCGGCDGCDGCDGYDCDNDSDVDCGPGACDEDGGCGGCAGGGCGDSNDGGCGNSSGGGGSCSASGSPARGAGLVWVLLPVPAALIARWRARRVVPADRA